MRGGSAGGDWWSGRSTLSRVLAEIRDVYSVEQVDADCRAALR